MDTLGTIDLSALIIEDEDAVSSHLGMIKLTNGRTGFLTDEQKLELLLKWSPGLLNIDLLKVNTSKSSVTNPIKVRPRDSHPMSKNRNGNTCHWSDWLLSMTPL